MQRGALPFKCLQQGVSGQLADVYHPEPTVFTLLHEHGTSIDAGFSLYSTIYIFYSDFVIVLWGGSVFAARASWLGAARPGTSLQPGSRLCPLHSSLLPQPLCCSRLVSLQGPACLVVRFAS